MTDDQDPRYDETTEPEQPAETWVDQPPLFEEPAPTPHDIEPAGDPEGGWEQPEDELTWEAGVDPGEPEVWFPMPHADAEEAQAEDEPPAEDEALPDAEAEPEVQAAELEAGEETDGPSLAEPPLDGPLDPAGDDQDLLLAPPAEAYDDGTYAYPADDDQTGPYADDEELVAAPAREGGALVAILSVLVVALLLLTGWLGYVVADNRGPRRSRAPAASALAAGRDAARLVFSYDYRHLDKDFAAAAAVTTGTFKTDYESTTKKLVGDVAPTLQGGAARRGERGRRHHRLGERGPAAGLPRRPVDQHARGHAQGHAQAAEDDHAALG